MAVPDGPACTSPPPFIMPPRLLPHERRNPHCPPSPSPAHRADRVDRRDHTEGGPHERGRRRRPPCALAAASPGSRARSSAGWWPTSSLPRIGSRLKLRHISLRNDSDAEGQQGRQCTQQPAAVGSAQRAVGGGIAPLLAEPRAELEDVAWHVTVPAASTFRRFPQLEGLLWRPRREFCGTGWWSSIAAKLRDLR